METFVSILIPCYNAERWVAQAIQSALDQTWPNKEVIVMDDGSTDGSLKAIQSFGERIRWETGPNRGGNAARHRLLELAKGEWLQYLDADDYLLPDKVAGQMEFLAANPDSDVLYSPVLIDFWSPAGSSPVPNPWPFHTGDRWVALVRWHTPQTGAYLFRRSIMLEAGGWNPAQPYCQDNEMCLRLLMRKARFLLSPKAGAVYRIWGDQTVSTRNQTAFLECRLEILQRAEDFLRGNHELHPERLEAINQARFELARAAWTRDAATARHIIHLISASLPGFAPHGPTAPGLYRLLFGLFGFAAAERCAAFKRSLKGLFKSCKLKKINQVMPLSI